MHRRRRKPADPAVVVLIVVPIEECPAEGQRILLRPEAIGKLRPVLHRLELRLGKRVVIGHVRTAVAMNHFDLAAFGYRFDCRGRSIGYTGDTGECSQLDRLLDSVDVAILELTHARESSDPGHMDPPAFEKIAKWLVRQGSTVIATHMSSTPDPIPGVEICEDGKTYWI